jgi:hypothetical protein
MDVVENERETLVDLILKAVVIQPASYLPEANLFENQILQLRAPSHAFPVAHVAPTRTLPFVCATAIDPVRTIVTSSITLFVKAATLRYV